VYLPPVNSECRCDPGRGHLNLPGKLRINMNFRRAFALGRPIDVDEHRTTRDRSRDQITDLFFNRLQTARGFHTNIQLLAIVRTDLDIDRVR
jgi:hypothetical protein